MTSETVSNWNTSTVVEWLNEVGQGLESYVDNFVANDVDGETLLGIEPWMVEKLIPSIKFQVRFLKEVKKLRERIGTESQTDDETSNPDPASMPAQTDVTDEAQTTPSRSTDVTLESQSSTRRRLVLLNEDLPGYQLPKFPDPVKIILATKKNPRDYFLGSLNRRKIIHTITTDLEQKGKLRLSQTGYRNIMTALFKNYPFLGDQTCWKSTLIRRMKKIRAPLTNSPDIKALKELYGRKGEENVGRPRKRPLPDEGDVLRKRQRTILVQEPGADSIEDPITIKKHIQVIQSEARKNDPDMSLIKRKMVKTSSYRRKRVHDESVSLKTLLEEFPILRNRVFLNAEVLLQHNLKTRDQFSKLNRSALELSKFTEYKCKAYKQYNSKYLSALDDTIDEGEKTEITMRFCYELLPSLFGESEGFLIVNNKEDIRVASPVIVAEGARFSIFVEGQSLMKKPQIKFSHAIQAWFDAYWAFAFEYPAKLMNTCIFIEHFVLGHDCQVPKILRSWAKKLGL